MRNYMKAGKDLTELKLFIKDLYIRVVLPAFSLFIY